MAKPPKFVYTPPEEVYEDDGADLYLNCSASGSPKIMVAWYKENDPEPIVSDRLSAMLFIPRFTVTDEGSYYCRASLYDQEIEDRTVLKLRKSMLYTSLQGIKRQLRVLKAILQAPHPQVESVVVSPAVVGDDFTITCTVSNWKGQVLFVHNREPVNLEQGSRYSVDTQPQGQVNGEWHTVAHALSVRQATLGDSGVVECYLTPDIFGSTDVMIKEHTGLISTPESTDKISQPDPTLSPGKIVELRGPSIVTEGATLLLTCLVSPVVQHCLLQLSHL
ncbi:putative Immunoglobulin domain-containing protein 6 [Homarus americanus]|uniref:Putative Immunoglobulin domain-containing protein 6 n=1 Tax=Homarus americanus TaxID=6706 RepID=A0A8J5K4S0_HOMAM|nr:putative Immunoglobulin domain-containing protein 6 [Homarus americanus]